MLTEGEANGELLERFYKQVYGNDLFSENMEGRLTDRAGCYQESSYNEIYAKHGYMFQSEDLNNYFLGCAWYTPLYTAEEFDDSESLLYFSTQRRIPVINLDIIMSTMKRMRRPYLPHRQRAGLRWIIIPEKCQGGRS